MVFFQKFLPTLTHIFTVAQWFGIPSYGNKFAICWAVIVLCMLTVVEGAAIWMMIRLLAGIAKHIDDGRKLLFSYFLSHFISSNRLQFLYGNSIGLGLLALQYREANFTFGPMQKELKKKLCQSSRICPNDDLFKLKNSLV